MHIAIKSAALGTLMSAAGLAGAVAQTAYTPPYPAAAYRASTTTLPEVVVPGRGITPHYRVPAGYDADVALHPYTSGLGPCTEGASPDQGCRHSAKQPIAPSHYERWPFMR